MNKNARSILRSKLFQEYLTFLKDHRGLAEATLDIRQRYVAPFLQALKGPRVPSKLHSLQASTIHDYVIKNAGRISRAKRKHLASSLRSFLRFAHVFGYLNQNLAEAVPRIVTYSLASIPRTASWASVKKLLTLPDRRTHLGRRDYAIFQLLATYGVRIGQALSVKLNDIKWDEGVIYFQASKGGKSLRFPLQEQVATALLTYVRKDRRRNQFSEVFLSYRGKPMGGYYSRNLKLRYKRLGIELPVRDLHSIRHAFATRLMEQGTPIKTIADLLGHRRLNNTFIYTKVDIKHLRTLAANWPEVMP